MSKKVTRIVAGITAVGAILYLVNPGLGVFELLPDNIPLIGNLDEASATVLLIWSLQYLGVRLFQQK